MKSAITRESTSQGPLPTAKADLIAETQAMVISLNNTIRQVADNLAALRDRHDMTQQEIADALGKKQAWVSTMLKWRDEGLKEETPFGSFSKAAGKRKADGKATSRSKPADYQATDNQQERAEERAERRKA